jgi:LPXTG-motif cell wall-anchored protein
MLASGSLVGVAALAAVLTAPTAAADEGPAGSAYALSVATTLLNQPLVTVPPRPAVTYPDGGNDSLAKVGPNAGGLVTADVLNASSVRKGKALHSAASIADVTVKGILTASVVKAECTAKPGGVTGRSSVADLTVLGQEIDLTVARGEIDVLGVATVRLDEQVRVGDALVVNAVHVIVDGPVGNVTSADIVLSQAKCAWDGGREEETTSQPTSSTTTTTTPTGTLPTGTSTSPTWTTTTTTKTSKRPTWTTTTEQGVANASSDEDLAETGVSGVLPISLAGLLLLAGGAGALLVTRRRRANRSTES